MIVITRVDDNDDVDDDDDDEHNCEEGVFRKLLGSMTILRLWVKETFVMLENNQS